MTNLNILYIHLNAKGAYVYDTIPDFAEVSVRQSRKFHDGPIFFLSMHKADWFDKYNVTWLDLKHPQWNYDLIWEWTHTLKPDEGVFWHMTMMRMALIDVFVDTCSKVSEKEHIDSTHTLYLEYDNLIYQNTDVLADFCYDKVMYSFVSMTEASPGIMIFPHTDTSSFFFDEFVGECHKQKSGRITDMTVLRALGDSLHVNELDQVDSYGGVLWFDGASYGQYFGGTNNGHPKGFIDPNHYVGKWITNRHIFPHMGADNYPYVIYQNKFIPLFNLHIHSKKLKDFEV
jgi:hypothetical protein